MWAERRKQKGDKTMKDYTDNKGEETAEGVLGVKEKIKGSFLSRGGGRVR